MRRSRAFSSGLMYGPAFRFVPAAGSWGRENTAGTAERAARIFEEVSCDVENLGSCFRTALINQLVGHWPCIQSTGVRRTLIISFDIDLKQLVVLVFLEGFAINRSMSGHVEIGCELGYTPNNPLFCSHLLKTYLNFPDIHILSPSTFSLSASLGVLCWCPIFWRSSYRFDRACLVHSR